MAIQWMSHVLQNSTQTGTAKMVLLAIADKADHEGVAWPSNAYLARVCNVTPRTIRRIIGDLVACGDLKIVDPGGDGPKHTRRVKIKGDTGDPHEKIRGTSVTAKGDTGDRIRGTLMTPNTSIDTSEDTSIDISPEKIYDAYPRHIGKKAALPKIKKAVDDLRKAGIEDAAAYLLARTLEFAASPAGQRGNFTPHPATWFNQGRYNDDPKEWKVQTNGKARPTVRDLADQQRRVIELARRAGIE